MENDFFLNHQGEREREERESGTCLLLAELFVVVVVAVASTVDLVCANVKSTISGLV
jgi:hypothetical protein